jgi:hypothetical protein
MSTLGKVVGAISPVLGNILNAVLPGSGLVISGLMSLFGVTSNDQDELATKIGADPNAAEKLSEFVIAHKYDLERLQQADQASARDMNIQTTKATGRQDNMLHVLGLGSFLMVFFYVLLSYFIPEHFSENVFHDLLNICTFVFSFYFGGMYIQARSKDQKEDVTLPTPAQTR